MGDFKAYPTYRIIPHFGVICTMRSAYSARSRQGPVLAILAMLTAPRASVAPFFFPAGAVARGSGWLRSSLDPPCAPWPPDGVGAKGAPQKSTPRGLRPASNKGHGLR